MAGSKEVQLLSLRPNQSLQRNLKKRKLCFELCGAEIYDQGVSVAPLEDIETQNPI